MNNKLLVVIVIMCLFGGGVFAQRQQRNDLFSPYNAEPIHEIAKELYPQAKTDIDTAKRAMILLEAVRKLNPRAEHLLEDVIRFSVLFGDNRYGDVLQASFKEYIDGNSDLDVLRSIVRYGMDQLNTREQREAYLLTMLNKVGKENPAFASELGTQLALLDIEKGDVEAAKTRLIRAYDLYPYNALAFEKMSEVFEQSELVMQPAIYASELRRRMILNPAGIGTALAFADYVQQLGLYDIAASAYEYAANLYMFMYPTDQLPASFYLPWSIACYNTSHQKMKCFEIAQMVRASGRFDLVLEGLAGRVAIKTGDYKESKQLLISAQKAEQLVDGNTGEAGVTPEQLAWFYAFVSTDLEKSLAWANCAYSANPKSEQVKSLLGYAFVLNGNYDLSKDLVEELADQHQIAAIAMALIKLNQGQNEEALEGLKSSVSMDPSSLAAESAITRIRELGSEYIPVYVPENAEKELKRNFGEDVIPAFTELNKIVDVKLSIPGREFRYGYDLKASVSITNRSGQPLVISDSSFIKGDIRIDAQVRGDINTFIPNLIQLKLSPSAPLEQNRSVVTSVNLMTGKLKKILNGHPQANLLIDFTVYVDPVVTKGAGIRNAMGFIKPETNTIARQKVNVLRDSLITQLNYISSGQVKQRIKGIRLFAGLLSEYYESQTPAGLSYPAIPIDLPLLNSALRKGLNDEDWTVRFHTMAALIEMGRKIEFSFVRRISELLNSDYWAERLMALYLLNSTQGPEFGQVIDWVQQNDSEEVVRDYAAALKKSEPKVEEKYPEQTDIIMDSQTEEMVEMLIEP